MKKYKTILIISLFVILMSVFGNVMAQDAARPAIKVSSVETDTKVILITKDFPANTSYIVYMASSEAPEDFTAVAKFNSNSGGKLSITVKIPAKFYGNKTIELKLEDEHGGVIAGSFVNVPEEPAEEPVSEEPAAEGPAEDTSKIELVNEEPVKEEPVSEEPAAEEPVAEEPAAEETVKEEPVSEEPAVEEPAAEETVKEEPAAEEPAAEEPAAEEPAAEEPAAEETVKEEPAAEEPAEDTSKIELVNEETVKEEPAKEETASEDTSKIELANEETVKEETVEVKPVEETIPENNAPLVCDFSRIPSITITGVARNESVTFVTSNFPADSTFSVSMGYYVSTWVPVREPVYGKPHHGHHQPVEALYPHEEVMIGDEVFYVLEPVQPDAPDFRKPVDGKHKPGSHRITGYVTSAFSGTQVGTFETGNGAPQTLTFEIPSSLMNVNPIAIWISDMGPCGFYSYNYFYNNSTN